MAIGVPTYRNTGGRAAPRPSVPTWSNPSTFPPQIPKPANFPLKYVPPSKIPPMPFRLPSRKWYRLLKYGPLPAVVLAAPLAEAIWAEYWHEHGWMADPGNGTLQLACRTDLPVRWVQYTANINLGSCPSASITPPSLQLQKDGQYPLTGLPGAVPNRTWFWAIDPRITYPGSPGSVAMVLHAAYTMPAGSGLNAPRARHWRYGRPDPRVHPQYRPVPETPLAPPAPAWEPDVGLNIGPRGRVSIRVNPPRKRPPARTEEGKRRNKPLARILMRLSEGASEIYEFIEDAAEFLGYDGPDTIRDKAMWLFWEGNADRLDLEDLHNLTRSNDVEDRMYGAWQRSFDQARRNAGFDRPLDVGPALD